MVGCWYARLKLRFCCFGGGETYVRRPKAGHGPAAVRPIKTFVPRTCPSLIIERPKPERHTSAHAPHEQNAHSLGLDLEPLPRASRPLAPRLACPLLCPHGVPWP